MKAKVVALVILCLSTLGVSATEDTSPLGETAHYEINKDSDRTSGLIRSGTLDVEVVSFHPENGEYKLELAYDMKVFGAGRQRGVQENLIPTEFFDGSFLARLREEKEIVLDKFSVRHEGYGDAELKSGQVYENCDRILIYDVKQELAPNLVRMIDNILLAGKLDGPPTEDQELRAYIHGDIDALGAARLDLTGKSSGIRIKAGFDFVR